MRRTDKPERGSPNCQAASPYGLEPFPNPKPRTGSSVETRRREREIVVFGHRDRPGFLEPCRGIEPEQKRRVALANWIADPRNPLTARVMVNRIWQYIFGAWIVDTPSDFGLNGGTPSNPALLDWLADEFVRSGWSVKHIEKLILVSQTFGQSAAPRPEGLERDASARLLWRFPPRRLDAEAIRDCILAVSGALDTRMGGPGFHLQRVEDVTT